MRMCEIENLTRMPVWAVPLSKEATVVSHLVSQIWFVSDAFYASIVPSLYILRRLYTHTLSLSRTGDPPPTIDSSRCAILNLMLHLYFAWSNFSLAWAPGKAPTSWPNLLDTCKLFSKLEFIAYHPRVLPL